MKNDMVDYAPFVARKELQVLTEAAQVLKNAVSQGASFFQLSERLVRRRRRLLERFFAGRLGEQSWERPSTQRSGRLGRC